ncbi:MAG: thermonuclease family protein [Candidatus Electronema sp. VV]
MRNIIGAVLLCLLPLASTAYGWQGQVVKVSDGDTLQVQQGREIVKVRLYGVDCPEKRQNFGRQAMQFTEQFLGGTVEVETVDRDRYGRTVGLVSSGGKLLNRELVREGHAWFYAAYCRKQPLCTELRDLEERARKRKAGLWQEKRPLPPWEWRQRNPR